MKPVCHRRNNYFIHLFTFLCEAIGFEVADFFDPIPQVWTPSLGKTTNCKMTHAARIPNGKSHSLTLFLSLLFFSLLPYLLVIDEFKHCHWCGIVDPVEGPYKPQIASISST